MTHLPSYCDFFAKLCQKVTYVIKFQIQVFHVHAYLSHEFKEVTVLLKIDQISLETLSLVVSKNFL